MKVELRPDFEVTDESCRAATGKTFAEWFDWIDSGEGGAGRRNVVNAIYDATGRGADVWWPTTIWVEYEAAKGIVKKDGLAEGYNICCTKTISAPVEIVYFALAGTAKEGNEYSDPEGNSGTWLRLRPGKDVRLQWRTAGIENETLMDCALADKGKGKTGVVLNHQRIQTRAEADGLRRAWGQFLDELKSGLED
ncbi:hypothetical protein CCB80_12515 [Armatimonadetes bacterium Uphvl-Ar1]|nr:hypothetical protein CCB80_12515 [Armatimonadetes bacterium Uphvl-Ar1]